MVLFLTERKHVYWKDEEVIPRGFAGLLLHTREREKEAKKTKKERKLWGWLSVTFGACLTVFYQVWSLGENESMSSSAWLLAMLMAMAPGDDWAWAVLRCLEPGSLSFPFFGQRRGRSDKECVPAFLRRHSSRRWRSLADRWDLGNISLRPRSVVFGEERFLSDVWAPGEGET